MTKQMDISKLSKVPTFWANRRKIEANPRVQWQLAKSLPIDEIYVGMKCTVCVGSDRYVHTVVRTTAKKVFIDDWNDVLTSDGKGGFHEERKPTVVFLKTYDGGSNGVETFWATEGSCHWRVYFGVEEEYRDPSF